MVPGRTGAVRLLERISAGSSTTEICAAVKAEGFPTLDALGPRHLLRAAEHWRLCRLGLANELGPVLKELAMLPHLDLVLSLGHDLAVQPPGQAWSPGHPLRVATIARLLATEGIEHAIRWKELRWSARPTEDGLRGIMVGALFHDIGKLFLPAKVRQGPPTKAGMSHLEDHPRLGSLALQQVAWPWPEVLSTVLHHHERWDGTGYPDGLQGDDIPWEAQILALSDFRDAMSTATSYREGLDSDQVAALLRSQSGRAFNPVLVKVLLAIWDRVEEELAKLPEPTR